MTMLMAADVAAEYTRVNGWKKLSSARDLLDDIEQFMISRGLEKSSINRYDVAQHVMRLQRAQMAVAEAEAETVYQREVAEGTTASDSALDEMSLLGTEVARSTASHLFRL